MSGVNVVSYRNSTSNHNLYPVRIDFIKLYLIEILHQTTTNSQSQCNGDRLYLIEILHQTTTQSTVSRNDAALYLIEILHQTTTEISTYGSIFGCILSKFYIKPQLVSSIVAALAVVSYRNSTSNHNGSVVPHDRITVVSYRNSTSNHNCT